MISDLDVRYFSNCLSPVLVTRKGQPTYYPCGKCQACQNRKSKLNANKCQLQHSLSGHCLFITLTYKNAFLPRMQFVRTDDESINKGFGVYSLISLNRKEISDINDIYISHNSFNDLMDKTKKDTPYNQIPVICMNDAIKFIKRYRSKLFYIYGEQPLKKYFIVSEYGPKHYRPHFHILFFFDRVDKERASKYRNLVHNCWKFGNTDASFANGKAENYVSNYVNSLTSLSKVHSIKEIKGKSSHSIHFAEHPYFLSKNPLQTDVREYLMPVDYKCYDKIKHLSISASLQNNLFPKCYHFNELSNGDIYFSYTFYSRLKPEYQQLNNFLNYVWSSNDSFCLQLFKLLDIPINSEYEIYRNFEMYESKLKRAFYLSRHFCRISKGRYYEYIEKIKDFYSLKALKSLGAFYKKIEDLSCSSSSEDFADLQGILYFNNSDKSFITRLTESQIFKKSESLAYSDYSKRIKHKTLNDQFNLLQNG